MVVLLAFLSLSAEVWSNNKPLILKYEKQYYFPVFFDYDPKNFDQEGLFTDYRLLKNNPNAWSLWPLNEWGPLESNKDVKYYPSAPSLDNLLGTDDRGRDVLARLLYGLRYSLIYAVLVWILTFFTGTLIGSAQGFIGGKFDLICQRGIEVLSTVPQLLLLIIIISVFRPSLLLLVVITCIFGWIHISYYMRAEILKNRKQDYVEAARALGVSSPKLFIKHLLPNSLGPLITFSPFAIVANISSLAALDYLGFGLPAPTPSWGELLAQAQNNFSIAWWLAFYPSLALFFVLTFFSLVGEGVRDAFDPRHSSL